MKRPVVIFAVLLLLCLNLFTGCGPKNDTAISQEPEDYVVEWVDQTVELLVRDFINKPEGDILRSELDFVEEINILGGVYLFMNGENKEGISEIDISHHTVFRTEGTRLKIEGEKEEYEPISIAVCDDFAHFRNLKSLNFSETRVEDISALKKLTGLEKLKIYSDNMPDLGPLAELDGLQSLELTNVAYQSYISDVSFLSELKKLKSLNLYSADFSNLGLISEFTGLEKLFLSSCNISDISPLGKLTGLRYLSLSDNRISDIGVIKNFKNLEWLFLDNNQISDVSPLKNLKSLTHVSMSGNPIINIDLLAELPETCEVEYDPSLMSSSEPQAAAPSQSIPSSTSQVQSSAASYDSSAGTLKGIWVDEIGITNSGGMSTLPPGILFRGNELYIGTWYSGVTPEDIIADAGGQGYDGPTGTYELKSGKIIITWNGGSGTAEWKLSGDTFSTGQTKFVPDGGSYSGKVID